LMSLAVALIGVGRWGRNHARVLSQLRGRLLDRLVIVDKNVERAREVASRYGVDAVYGDIDEMLRREKDLDAAVIAVPTVFHYVVADALLDHTNVFIEKPLAATLEEGESLLSKARKLGRVAAVGHIERFNPVVKVCRQIVEGSEIVGMTARRLGPGPAGGYTLNLGVGHDLLVHDVDIVNLFMGELPRAVYARTYHTQGFPYEVEVAALYEYEGAAAFLEASWRTAPKYKHRSFQVRLVDKVVSADYVLRRIVVDEGIERWRIGDGREAVMHMERSGIEVSYLQEEPLRLEMIDFLESVKTGKKPMADIFDGYIALKSVVYALKSGERGERVAIEWGELDKYA